MVKRLGTTALVFAFVCATHLSADDPAGKWKWEHPDMTGGMATDTIVINNDGGKITGKFISEQGELDLENAKLDGDEVSFDITFDGGGQSMTIAFKAKAKGDSLTGTISSDAFGEFPLEATKEAGPAVDPVGTWRWVHDDPAAGQVKDTLVITKDGDKLGGSYINDQLEEKQAISNVKIDGDTLSWEMDIDMQGQQLHLTFSGKVSGDDVNGNVSLGDFGEFPWDAKRDAKSAAGGAEAEAWNLTLNMPDGTSQDAVLKVSNNNGEYAATYEAMGQEWDVEDMKVSEDGSFSFTLNIEEMGITAKFNGTATDTDAKGTIEFDAAGQTGEMEFTAEKAE